MSRVRALLFAFRWIGTCMHSVVNETKTASWGHFSSFLTKTGLKFVIFLRSWRYSATSLRCIDQNCIAIQILADWAISEVTYKFKTVLNSFQKGRLRYKLQLKTPLLKSNKNLPASAHTWTLRSQGICLSALPRTSSPPGTARTWRRWIWPLERAFPHVWHWWGYIDQEKANTCVQKDIHRVRKPPSPPRCSKTLLCDQ